MPDASAPASVVFVAEKGQPDEQGSPAALVQPQTVLVPNPTNAIQDRTAELEVVIVAMTDVPPMRVERIRVAGAWVVSGQGTPTLVLSLERPASNPCTPVGSAEEGPLLAQIVVAHHYDLWDTLSDLGRLPALAPTIPSEALERVRAYTSEPHPPSWPGPGDWINPIAWLINRK